MARYMETAADLAKEVDSLMKDITDLYFGDALDLDDEEAEQNTFATARQIGHIINLAIRACPRGVQHTVRLNIVREAVGKYCKVSMTEEVDERTQRTFHKIHIVPRS